MESRAQKLRLKLSENRGSLEAIRASNDALAGLQEAASRRAHVIGRISLYVESLPETADTSDLRLEIKRISAQITKLEEELSDERKQEKLDSIISVVSAKMTELARKLNLEHSDSPLRLDLQQMTVVADTIDDGAYPDGSDG